MTSRYQKKLLVVSIAAASAVFPPAAVHAQEEKFTVEEVIVTARRRDEMLQEIPMTVNVVTGEEVEKLNLRKVEDLKYVIPGLTLSEDPIAPNASMRGVRFDTFASGYNPTVEFYLNDAPVVSSTAMQAMFDIGQVEVLRGPQGTLRGRASPSGSITLTTITPNLNEFEGYLDVTGNDIGGQNYRGAVNIPIAQDVMAVRLAGFYEENEGAGVKSITSGRETEYEGSGYRATVLLEPTDTLSFNLMYQKLLPHRKDFGQVESANIADSSQPASPQMIRPGDRQAVSDDISDLSQNLERINFEAAWEIGAAQLNYVGSRTEQVFDNVSVQDNGGFFNASYPEELRNYVQDLNTSTEGSSHEIRLTSVDPIFNESVDYVFGMLYQENSPGNDVIQQTPVFLGAASPGTYITSAYTAIETGGKSREQSVFGNLTWHITEDTELSGGARYIEFKNSQTVVVGGNTISDTQNNWEDTIFSLSLTHNITDNMTVYGSYGTSWRPGVDAVGNFSIAQTPREQSFQHLDPETSESLELGFKSTWLDNRLRFNATAYRQEFDNYPYRAGGGGINYVSTEQAAGGTTEIVKSFNFVSAVPVIVNGIELETYFAATENWDMSFLYSWSKGEIDNGTVACEDYNPADGQPDTSGTTPTAAQIRAATGGDNVGSCNVNYRSNYAPLWTGTFQTEYRYPVGAWNGYVRGLLTLYGDSQNDPTNSIDDVDSYNIVNLYTGLKSPQGTWEVMLYGKNVFETERVLSRDAAPESVGYTSIAVGPGGVVRTGGTGVSTYREITMTAPREIGVNVRYNF